LGAPGLCPPLSIGCDATDLNGGKVPCIAKDTYLNCYDMGRKFCATETNARNRRKCIDCAAT